MSRFSIADVAIDTQLLRDRLAHPDAGGFCAFEGWVRNSNEGRDVSGLSYEAYEVLAQSEGEEIIAEALARYGIVDACCVHRVGDLAVGDMAVWVGAAAAHRDEAFRACRYIIDGIKHRLPIWKKEHYLDGDVAWVACTHGTQGHQAHAHHESAHHSHAQHEHAAPSPTLTADYSRQTRLREVGPQGQEKLSAAKVLVIGAGGLGAPVISYLAGAGVGTLGIIDPDHLEASNLHRQTIYDARDIGQAKAVLAARRATAINPSVEVSTFSEKLHAGNAAALFSEYDLVLECTDDMHSRYLASDAAVLANKPLILASVYQYEGQLQVFDAKPGAACMRCLWPDEPAPEDAGSCAVSGVLGPVPGVLGTLQAMEALKLLLDLPRPAAPTLLLVNLLDNTMQHLPIDVAAGCAAKGGCAEQARRALELADDNIDQDFDSLDAAIAAGFRLIDVRSADEVIDAPLPISASEQIPAAMLDARIRELGEDAILLVCTSGRRSTHAARMLRAHGRAQVFSLAGGLAGLSPRR